MCQQSIGLYLCMLLLAGGATATGRVSSANAASFCANELKGGEATAKTEAEAQTAAKVWWSSRAGSLGEGYQDWEQAKEKSVTCHDGAAGTKKCIASAKPCLRDGNIPKDPNGPRASGQDGKEPAQRRSELIAR